MYTHMYARVRGTARGGRERKGGGGRAREGGGEGQRKRKGGGSKEQLVTKRGIQGTKIWGLECGFVHGILSIVNSLQVFNRNLQYLVIAQSQSSLRAP